MAIRISDKSLEAVVARINALTNSPMQPWTDGKSNAGNYHIDSACGGVSLHRMVPGGGEADVFRCGHVSKRQLYELMHAFVGGIEAATGV